MRKTLCGVAACVVVASLVGCSSGPAKGDGRDCLDVPADTIERIVEGANDLPIEPIAAAAVRSESFKDMNIVAMSFTWPDGEESTGIWGYSGEMGQPGTILAIDGYAANSTDWPHEVNGEKLTSNEDGATEAVWCLSQLG